MKGARWYYHPAHGYMLRVPTAPNWELCVTALCAETAEIEQTREAWEAHKRRLRVNGGCGAIAVDEYRAGDRNPDFAPIDGRRVPAHIRRDFAEFAKGPDDAGDPLIDYHAPGAPGADGRGNTKRGKR